MRTVVYLKGEWSFTVAQTADEVEQLIEQPGPRRMIELDLPGNPARRIRVDPHAIVAIGSHQD